MVRMWNSRRNRRHAVGHMTAIVRNRSQPWGVVFVFLETSGNGIISTGCVS